MGYADSDARKWVYHTQTEKKHKILKSYLDAWFPILGSWNRRLVVVDGFAGRARYTPRVDAPPNDVGKIEGSPLIMLKSLIDHDRFRDKGLDRLQFVFLFIELNDENHRLLQEEIDQYKASLPSWPTNVTVLRGVEAMKNAMWKWDPDAAEALCARAEPLEVQLLRYFRTKLPGESFGISEIEEFILADTPFRKSAGTAMLKKLEDNGNIALDEGGRSGKGYLKDSKFSFTGEGNMNGGTKRKQIRPPSQSGSPSKKQTTITSFFKPQKA